MSLLLVWDAYFFYDIQIEIVTQSASHHPSTGSPPMPINYNTLTLAVEGYADQRSYLPGEEVCFHCSARVASFSVEITRVGLNRETVWRHTGIAGQEHPTPPDAYAKGCGWPVTFSFHVGETWQSGFYEVLLRGDGVQGVEAIGHAFFVVRSANPGRDSSILLVLSTNTYNAYNRWGGHCLYTGATQVSFARPLERGYVYRPPAAYDGRAASVEPEPDPTHRRVQEYLRDNHYPLWIMSAGWPSWEHRFVRWAESNGYRVDMAINSDLEFHPEILDNYQLMVSMGHDEYWSWGMRDAIDRFVDRGGNLAVFSGNTCFWQVRYEDDGQTMVCYKDQAHAKDPVMGTARQQYLSSLWSDPLIGRPENKTTGLSFTRAGYARMGEAVPRGSGAYTIYRPDHWAFANTGLRYGDLLGLGSFVVAYETDGCELILQNGLPVPTHADGTPENFTILATSPAHLISINSTVCEAPAALWASLDPPGELEFIATRLYGDASPENTAKLAHGNTVMGIFTRGGTVLNVGSTDWAYGLDDNALIQQVTRNILNRLSQQ
jgi:hypothetical protein